MRWLDQARGPVAPGAKRASRAGAHRHAGFALIAAATAALAPALARAETEVEPGTPPATHARDRINLRLGNATSDSTGRPTICLDVRVFARLGIESCGTGQGVIHDQPGSEMAHFRATWSVVERATPSGTGRLRGGIGFAELQVGVDHPGFRFGEPDQVDRGSVAGPEAVVQGQWLVPLGGGVEAVASLTGGVAVFAHADQLVLPRSNVQPFASLELGLGW